MSRNENIFHLVLILALVQISDASPKRPDGHLIKTKLGKIFLGASNKDKEESLEIVNKNFFDKKPHKPHQPHQARTSNSLACYTQAFNRRARGKEGKEGKMGWSVYSYHSSERIEVEQKEALG